MHLCPTCRVFSGTGLELLTRQATIRYLYHLAAAAAKCRVTDTYCKQQENSCNPMNCITIQLRIITKPVFIRTLYNSGLQPLAHGPVPVRGSNFTGPRKEH
ncbi:hypothetical protein TNCV_4600661 [Trichonephila clavipes]|nr:hypothetical protein TNCV_4600661 [Trichonephila clavipes]